MQSVRLFDPAPCSGRSEAPITFALNAGSA